MLNKLLSLFLSFVIVWESIPISNLYAQTANVGSITFGSNGIPAGSVPRSDVDFAKLKTRISANLPETVQVNSKFLSDDITKTNIELKKDANVYITFLFEGAGYVNWFGYFLFNSVPASPASITIYPIFPRVDDKALALGTRIKIGSFTKGQKIGFVIVSDGYANGSSSNLNGQVPWGYKTNGALPKGKFFSLNSLNPVATIKKGVDTVGKPIQRVAYQWDAENKLGVISFDDQWPDPKGTIGDYDFNDVVFTVDSDPADAILPADDVIIIGTVKMCHIDDKGKETDYSFDLPTKQADYDLHKTHPLDVEGNCKDKVNICHYPPGNPENPQNISIGASAVSAHVGPHEFDAVVADKNVVCPPKYPNCSEAGAITWGNTPYDNDKSLIKMTKKGNANTCSKDICKNGQKSSVDLPYTLLTGETDAVFDVASKTSYCPVVKCNVATNALELKVKPDAPGYKEPSGSAPNFYCPIPRCNNTTHALEAAVDPAAPGYSAPSGSAPNLYCPVAKCNNTTHALETAVDPAASGYSEPSGSAPNFYCPVKGCVAGGSEPQDVNPNSSFTAPSVRSDKTTFCPISKCDGTNQLIKTIDPKNIPIGYVDPVDGKCPAIPYGNICAPVASENSEELEPVLTYFDNVNLRNVNTEHPGYRTASLEEALFKSCQTINLCYHSPADSLYWTYEAKVNAGEAATSSKYTNYRITATNEDISKSCLQDLCADGKPMPSDGKCPVVVKTCGNTYPDNPCCTETDGNIELITTGKHNGVCCDSDKTKCEEKPVVISPKITICHYTSNDKSSAEIKTIEEKDWYLYATSGDIKITVKEGEPASVEEYCSLTKKVALCDSNDKCCRNTNDGPEKQTGLYNGVCCPNESAPVRGSCDSVGPEPEPTAETEVPKEDKLEYCPGTSVLKIPGVDCPKDAVLPTTCPDGSPMPQDGICNKSVAPQTCAQKYPDKEQETSLKCCEDLPNGGTLDHTDMYNDVCCPSASAPVDGKCAVITSCEQYNDNPALKACCDDSSGAAVIAVEGTKNGYCCANKVEGDCPKTCEELAPGDKCCSGIGADNKSVLYKSCCDSKTGDIVKSGNDPHNPAQICGYEIDDGKGTPGCSFAGMKLPDFFCGAFKAFIPIMAGQVATFMIGTCLPGFLNPSGDAFFAAMLGYMILEIYNAFAYEEGTKLNLAFSSTGENDGAKELRSLEKEIELKLDIAQKKVKAFEMVMLAMHISEILVIAESLAFAISTIAAIAASAAAMATLTYTGVPYHAIYNMPYNVLGFIIPSSPGPPLLFPTTIPAGAFYTPSKIAYTQYGVPFIWFQCTLTPPVQPPKDPPKTELKELTGQAKKDYLKSLCVGASAAECAPSGIGDSVGVTADMCKVTESCEGQGFAKTICTGVADNVAKQVQYNSTGVVDKSCSIVCGGKALTIQVPVAPPPVPPLQPSVVSGGYNLGGTRIDVDDEGSASLLEVIQDKAIGFLDKHSKNNLYTNSLSKHLIEDSLKKLFVKDSYGMGAWAVLGLIGTVLISIIISLLLGYFQVYPRVMWDPYLRLAFIAFFGILMEIILNEHLSKMHVLENQLGQVKSLLSKISKNDRTIPVNQCSKNNLFSVIFSNTLKNSSEKLCSEEISFAQFFITESYAENKQVTSEKTKPFFNRPICFTGIDSLSVDLKCDCAKNDSCAKYTRPKDYAIDKAGVFKNSPETLTIMKEALQINQNSLNYHFNGQPQNALDEVQKLSAYTDKFKKIKGDLNKALELKLKELNEKRLASIKKSKNGNEILEQLKNKGDEISLDHRFIVPSKESMMKSVVSNLVNAMTKDLTPDQKNYLKNNDFSKDQSSVRQLLKHNILGSAGDSQKDKAEKLTINEPISSGVKQKIVVKKTDSVSNTKEVIYNITQEDITKNKDLDLFKIISNRIRLKHYEK